MTAGTGSRWRTSAAPALLLVIVQPILVKAVLLLGILKASPLLKLSGLGNPDYVGMPGATSLDPNVAYTSHALGTRAAQALASGESLWWNPYEGLGAPLAGGMQSAAFFPPTWLMLLPNGQVIEHVLFQIIAGAATFLLVRRMGLGLLAAWFAGTAFAFNGTFAWLANAVVNPICFLPVILLGVECLRADAPRARLAGGLCVALGIAASLYAGFPETAYVNALLVAGWTVVRASEWLPDRRRAGAQLLRAGVFALAGTLLAAPLLLAFLDFFMVANVGIHGAEGTANPVPPIYFTMFLLPYFTGAITHHPPDFWSGAGGYAGIALFALAAAGAFGASQRRLRLFLAGWAVLAGCAVYGIWPIIQLVKLFPGLDLVVVYRYAPPSILMALAVLASFLVDDLTRGRLSIAVVRRVLIAILALAAVLGAVSATSGLLPIQRVEYAPFVLQVLLLALLTGVVFVGRMTVQRRAALVAVAGALEIVALFAAPMISYPLRREAELGTIRFLQANLGLQRFVSAGPVSTWGTIAANYGSYFGIAQVNWNDLPVPQATVDYVRRHIDPASDAIVFRTEQAQVDARLPAYAAIGTRYVTVPAGSTMPGLREVHRDAAMRVYEVPGARPYFLAEGCAVLAADRATVTTDCPRPTRLQRLELMMAGWTAEVGGRQATVVPDREAFQAVTVPAGRTTTTFVFQPPSLPWGLGLAVLGLVLLAGASAFEARRPGRSPYASA